VSDERAEERRRRERIRATAWCWRLRVSAHGDAGGNVFAAHGGRSALRLIRHQTRVCGPPHSAEDGFHVIATITPRGILPARQRMRVAALVFLSYCAGVLPRRSAPRACCAAPSGAAIVSRHWLDPLTLSSSAQYTRILAAVERSASVAGMNCQQARTTGSIDR